MRWAKSLRGFVVFLGGLIAWPVWGEPIVTVRTRPYLIYPKTVRDLGPELDRRSPIIYQGKPYRGYTQWIVRWQYYWYETPQSCRITQVSTTLDVTYTLPQLGRPDAVDVQTRQVFNRYRQALQRHEENHKNSGLYAAQAIEKALNALPPASTCAHLQTTANALGNKILERYRQRDRDYDRQTDYGRKEGVILPKF